MAKRILIVRLSALGDTVLTMPLLAALRAKLPDAFIGWAVNEAPSELLEGFSGLDRLHVLRRSGRRSGRKSGSRIGAFRSIVREIARERYDVSLDAQGLTKSAMLPFLAQVPLRVGLAPGKVEGRELSRFLNNCVIRPPRKLRHIVARTLWLGTALGPPFGDSVPEGFPVEMPVDGPALRRVRAWWEERGLSRGSIAFGVGAGWPTKVWPVENVARLAKAALACSRGAVFLWGPAEKGDLARWREVLPEGAVLAPEMSVRDLVACLSLAGGYAGPDSVALHIAATLGKPTFSWFAASDPERCAPRGSRHVYVTAGVECAPCWKRKCRSLKCIAELNEEKLLPVFEEWLDA